MVDPQTILNEFPSTIAVHYDLVMDESLNWEQRTQACFYAFDSGMRSLILGILSKYFKQDSASLRDVAFEEQIKGLHRMELGYWLELFHIEMTMYHNRRHRFFMPELYDAYWPDDDSQSIRHLIQDIREQYNLYHASKNSDTKIEINQEFFETTLQKFHQLLSRFLFFKDYQLIHIKNIDDEGLAGYILYQGIKPSLKSEKFAHDTPQPGAIYLRSKSGHLFSLKPFFASYPLEFDGVIDKELQIDVGLLYVYARAHLETVYLLTMHQKPLIAYKNKAVLAQIFDDFDKLIFTSQTDTRLALDWDNLRQVAAKFSGHQMTESQKKYDKDTYLNREVIDKAFKDYLQKASTGFILLGKSGVGKSNFVIAQIGEASKDQQDIVAFLLDGGGTLDTDDILKTIYDELNKTHKIGLDNYDGEAFLHRLNSLMQNDNNRQILIVLDAINENDNATHIMTTANQWIRFVHQNKLHNIKFVITSRPQAWLNIRRGMQGQLDQAAYYRSSEANANLTFELKGFSADKDASIHMQEFDAVSELELVYNKYAKKYRIITPLQALPQTIRDDLSDPLILKLVMETYKEATPPEIPVTITSHNIIEKYLDYLYTERHVHEADFDLLTEIIVPMMCEGKDYINQITRKEIWKFDKEFNQGLIERIFNQEHVTFDDKTQKVNQSFTNLLNAEILVIRGQREQTEEIRFKYERFYDYYVSQYMRSAFGNFPLDERQQKYQELADKLTTTPFLWGPLYNRLLQEAEQGELELIATLTFSRSERIKDLLYATLAEYGKRPNEPNSHKKAPVDVVEEWCNLVLTRMPKKAEAFDAEDVMAGTLVIQIAEELLLRDVLVASMLMPYDFILDNSTNVLIDLWVNDLILDHSNVDAASYITEKVTDKLSILRPRQFKKTSRNLLVMIIGVFLLGYRYRNKNAQLTDRIQRELTGTIAKILKKVPVVNLFVGGKRGGRSGGGGIVHGLRTSFLRILANFVVYIALQVDKKGRILFDLTSVTTFFKQSVEERRAKYTVFLQHLDVQDFETTLQALEQPTYDNINEKELIGAYIMMLPLFGCLKYDSLRINRFLKDVFTHAFQTVPPNTRPDYSNGTIMLANHLITMRNGLIGDDNITLEPEGVENFGWVVEQLEKLYWSRFTTSTSLLPWQDIVSYYHFVTQLGKNIDYSMIINATRERLKRNDHASLPRFIHDFIFVGWHVIYKNPELAFDTLKVLLQELPIEYRQKNQEYIDGITADLLRLRAEAPYQTDLFLEYIPDTLLQKSIKQVVRTGKPDYNIADRVGVAASWFVRDIMLDDSPAMRQYLRWFLGMAIEMKNERIWISNAMNFLLDGIFTGTFPNPVELLDRQHDKK